MKNTINKSIFGILALVGLVFGAQTANAAGIPIMSNSTTTSITTTSAVLNGYYNDNGSPMTKIFFQYGDSPSMDMQSTASLTLSSYGNFSSSISGLTPNTTYYFQATGINAHGFGYSNNVGVFTTSAIAVPTAPVVSTNNATDITNTSATLSGYYNSNNSSAQTYFEYGTSSSSLSSTTNSASHIASFGTFTDSISGLAPGTKYYYRAVATNSTGTTKGSTLNFTTLGSGGNTGACRITSFTSSDDSVYAGSSVTLSWNTTGCSYVNFGSVGGASFRLSDSVNVTINSTSTYKLYAYGTNNNDTSSVKINVINNGGGNTGTCRITSFTSNTNSVYAGDRANLSWVTTGCTYVNFGSVGGSSFPLSGSATVTMNNTATYKLYAYGVNGNAVKSVTINVIDGGCLNSNCNTPKINECDWYNFNCNKNTKSTWTGGIITCAKCVDTDENYYYNSSVNQNNNKSNSSISNTTSTERNSDSVYSFSKNSKSLLGNSASASDVSTVDSQNSNIDGSNLAAGAGFSIASFLPSTLVGWLLFVIFVLIIIFIARKLTAKKNNNAHGHAH